jgi:hypothetical protein
MGLNLLSLIQPLRAPRPDRESSYTSSIMTYAVDDLPDGQVKFPHPWPPQIPPGRTAGL